MFLRHIATNGTAIDYIIKEDGFLVLLHRQLSGQRRKRLRQLAKKHGAIETARTVDNHLHVRLHKSRVHRLQDLCISILNTIADALEKLYRNDGRTFQRIGDYRSRGKRDDSFRKLPGNMVIEIAT